MKRHHEKPPKPPRVAEPVQVYLAPADGERLARLTDQLAATKSEVLRRGLEALERQLLDPAQHPALRLIGIAGGYPRRGGPGYDAAREHDRFLADSEESSWQRPPAGKRRGR